MTPVRILL